MHDMKLHHRKLLSNVTLIDIDGGYRLEKYWNVLLQIGHAFN